MYFILRYLLVPTMLMHNHLFHPPPFPPCSFSAPPPPPTPLNLQAIFFDRVTDEELEYTIRLRHEVPTANTWRTSRIGPTRNRPSPRVASKLV